MQNFRLVHGKKTNDKENLERIDFNIWVALIFLCCFGLIMVLSASSFKCASSKDCNYDSMYYFKRQALFVVLGFCGILVFRHYDYRRLKSLSFAAWAISIICIFLLLTPLGISVNGAKRWLGRGSVRFQVAEVVKISVILFLANMVTTYSKYLSKIQLTIYLWLAGGIPAILLFRISNDLSSAIIVLGITFGISFICTKTIKLHIGTLLAAAGAVALYVLNIWNHLPTPEELQNASFRVGRIAAWLAPERYSDDEGYQILQALYAIGNGGLLGKNLGNSVQKLYAIPEAHTDMIFSIVCEELGLIGATMLISLFLYLLYQLLRLALSTRDLFGSVIVLGIFLHISIQTIINLAVNVNLFPNTGLTLPFISYGGTSIFLLLMEMSIVFSIIQIRMGGTASVQQPPSRRKPSRLRMAALVLAGGQSGTARSSRPANTQSRVSQSGKAQKQTGRNRSSHSGRTQDYSERDRSSRSARTQDYSERNHSSRSGRTQDYSEWNRSSRSGRTQDYSERNHSSRSGRTQDYSERNRSSRSGRTQDYSERNRSSRSARTQDYSGQSRGSRSSAARNSRRYTEQNRSPRSDRSQDFIE